MGLVVANKYKGEIKSIADLKGRPLGVTSPGSQTHMVLGYLLAKNGVKADEVKIIGAGGNTMPLAIEKDSVHAGMLVDPFFTVFMKQGKGYALVDMFTTKGTLEAMGGEVQGTTLLTRPDVIAKRPATVQKMVNALVRANKFIVGSSGEELATMLPKEISGDPKLYAESFEHSREAFPPDSLVSARRRRPRHRDHARLRRRSGRNEDGAREPLRQQLRAEGPGAVARRPAVLRTWTGSRSSRGRRTRRWRRRSASVSGIAPGAVTTTRFSNENLKVKIEENVREQDVFVVQTAAPPLSENIVELLILLDALRHASARRVTAVLPYFPYARSDKKDEPRISITARLMADLLATAGAEPRADRRPALAADPGLLLDAGRSADRGPGAVRAAAARRAGRHGRGRRRRGRGQGRRAASPSGSTCRSRSSTSGAPATTSGREAVAVIGDVEGKRCLLVDDEIATGRHASSAPPSSSSTTARSASRRRWCTRCSRAARSSGSPPRASSGCSSPTPSRCRHASPKIEVLSVAPLLAEAITRIHDGRSVSALF